MAGYADRLAEAIKTKQSRLCVGLDPSLKGLPLAVADRYRQGQEPDATVEAFRAFCMDVVDAVEDLVPAVKPQVAFFEQYGPKGFEAFAEVCGYARSKGLLVIADIKRSDIGSTCEAYASGWLGEAPLLNGSQHEWVEVDAITVNPYFGRDGLEPFFELAEELDRGVYVLAKTSNPSWIEIQGLSLPSMTNVARHVLELIAGWGKGLMGERGYSSIGAVVPATHPEEATEMRAVAPATPFLIPGVGAQGAAMADVAAYFDSQGQGALVNVSRGVLRVFEPDDVEWQEKVREAARKYRDELNTVLDVAGKLGEGSGA
jgi:orotidine-5'-phosphate decarboxylase